MPSREFINWYKHFQDSGDICPLRLGMTRQEIKSILGEPDDKGGTSRKQKLPLIWKYFDLEFHFGPRSKDGVKLIYMETKDGIPLISIIGSLPEIR